MFDLPIPHTLYHNEAAIPPAYECGEPLVPLSNLSAKIRVYSYYYHQGYPGALQDCYLREGVARRLRQAAEQLPTGYALVVLDGWRPFQLQLALYEQFKQNLLKQGWPDDAALAEQVRKYVAFPSTQPDNPSPHLTGGAVDLTIAGPDGWLDMGTPFDDFSERAATRYYECLPDRACGEREEQIRRNRRWLYHLMTGAGFTNYPEEWWHYDYGDHHWAKVYRQAAIYLAVESLHFSEKY